MLKITIEVLENKNKDSCNVTLKAPKDITKGTTNEKNCVANLMNEFTKTLNNLKD